MQKLKENSLDFFKQSKIQQVDIQSKMQIMYAMLLYTFYKAFNVKKIIQLALVIGLGFGIYGIVQSSLSSEKQETATKSLALKENIENVSKITQVKINETVAFLDASRDKEITRLTQIYWIAKYLDKNNDLPHSMKYAINEIQKTIVLAKGHYANRKLELLQSYNLVQQKKYNFLTQTYDGKNALATVLLLVNANNMKTDYVTVEQKPAMQSSSFRSG